jgi:hypothetical protein
MSHLPHSPWFDTKYETPYCAASSILLLLHPALVQIFCLEPCSQTPSVYALLLMEDTKFHTHIRTWLLIFIIYPRTIKYFN